MRIIHDLHQANIEQETVLTIGTFDGLHLGHQHLLRQLVRRAKRRQRFSGVVTFDPPPRAVVDPARNMTCLTTTEDKIELLTQWGLDLLVILPFTPQLAHTSARDFVQMLCDKLRMAGLWIGRDFALGHSRTGNVSALKELGRMMGFRVHVIEPVSNGGVVISSTHIRSLIGAGRVREAAELLGRYHQLRGVVVRGKGRGRKLGFPRASLQVSQHCAVPASGVYAVYVANQGKCHPAVANIRSRPTCGDREDSIEVYLLDLNVDLYGQEIRLQFVDRLRAEQTFPSAKALRVQIEKDISKAREIL